MHALMVLVRFTPAAAVLGVVAWEVTFMHLGIANRHRGLVCCTAASIWAIYYAALAIIDLTHQHTAIGIVASGFSVMVASLARRAWHLVPEDFDTATAVDPVASSAVAASTTVAV